MVWQDFDREDLHSFQMSANSTPDLFGILDLTTDLMYSSFLLFRLMVFFRPLRLHLLNSSRPKIASLGRAVVSSLKTDTSDPGWSLITSSTGRSFGGVENGGGGGHGCIGDDGCCTGSWANG